MRSRFPRGRLSEAPPPSSLGVKLLPAREPRKKVQFRDKKNDAFYRALNGEVRAYFARNGKSQFGDWTIVAKAVLYSAIFSASYLAIVTNLVGPAAMPLVVAIFGLSAFLFALTVAHDAGHNSLTPSRRVNRLVRDFGFAVIGISGYLWQLRHSGSHHVFPNVIGCDSDRGENSIVRLSPNQSRRKYHRYQYIYAPFLYLLVGLHLVFFEDFRLLLSTRLGNIRVDRHPFGEYIKFAVVKLAYVALIVILPLAVVEIPVWQGIAGYIFLTCVQSATFVFLIIGNHAAERTRSPVADGNGFVHGSWATHALATTLDWSPTSRVANFVIGGFNSHVAHHLFPTVSHAHYVEISRFIKDAAARFGLPYHETTFLGMLGSHFRVLKALGRGDHVCATRQP